MHLRLCLPLFSQAHGFLGYTQVAVGLPNFSLEGSWGGGDGIKFYLHGPIYKTENSSTIQ